MAAAKVLGEDSPAGQGKGPQQAAQSKQIQENE